MLVQQILTSKATGGVVTVPPAATLAEAVAVLAGHRIGAVVVSEDGAGVAGILSERDVVRELAQHGPSCLAFPVSRVMTARITTCAPCAFSMASSRPRNICMSAADSTPARSVT